MATDIGIEMATDIGIDEPFYIDQSVMILDYYKCCIIALCTISTVSWGMMSCSTMAIYWISGRLNLPGQLGIAVLIGMDHPLYNDRLFYFRSVLQYAIVRSLLQISHHIALYKTSIYL